MFVLGKGTIWHVQVFIWSVPVSCPCCEMLLKEATLFLDSNCVWILNKIVRRSFCNSGPYRVTFVTQGHEVQYLTSSPRLVPLPTTVLPLSFKNLYSLYLIKPIKNGRVTASVSTDEQLITLLSSTSEHRCWTLIG